MHTRVAGKCKSVGIPVATPHTLIRVDLESPRPASESQEAVEDVLFELHELFTFQAETTDIQFTCATFTNPIAITRVTAASGLGANTATST